MSKLYVLCTRFSASGRTMYGTIKRGVVDYWLTEYELYTDPEKWDYSGILASPATFFQKLAARVRARVFKTLPLLPANHSNWRLDKNA